MKRTLIVLGILAIFLIAYGVLFFEPVKAGCGGHRGCNMSQTNSQQMSETPAIPGQYTCPMHPEVVSDTPGKCPKCGMNLEKVQRQVTEGQPTDSMGAQCQQVVDEFTTLQDHFDMMMKLTDVGYLAEAMVKHQEMMSQFAEDLARHQKSCSAVLGESKSTASTGGAHSDHNH